MKVRIDQMRRAVERPAADIRLYLLHGPDEASAYDVAERFGRSVGRGAERVDLDGATLRADPARLADEAASLSLFGEPRWVRVTGAGEESLVAVEALLAAERAGNPVLVIAPGLKATSKLVKLAQHAPGAIATACYAPTGRDAEQMVAELAAAHGVRLMGRVAARLIDASGGDRAVVAREIEKLALFIDASPDRPQTLDDEAFDKLGADLGDAGADHAVLALLEGRPEVLGTELIRLTDAGASPVGWLRALGRRLQLLADLQRDARGGNLEAVIERRVSNFTERAALLRAARLWTAPMLARALERVGAAERLEKSSNTAGEVLAGAMAMELARGVAGRR